MDEASRTVFISYSREDPENAERLYKDLKKWGLIPWRDKDAIRPGENWKLAISKAIKNSRFFMPLFSSKSVGKIGYVQKEFKYAMDIFERFPENEVYIIPVRLDNCDLPERLEDIQYVDLFPDWNAGFTQILETFKSQGIEVKQQDDQRKTDFEIENWHLGLSDKDWRELLTSICKKKCIPFIGGGAYTLETKDGKTLIPSSKDIIERWKESYRYPLEDLYKIANVYTLEDSYQLARLAQFLEIKSADEDEMYPKAMLSDILKEINVSDISVRFKDKSPYDILANLDLPIYITTNYDRFMEYALSRNSRKKPESDFCKWSDKLSNFVQTANIFSIFNDPSYKPTEDRPIVYHAHGDIETPESMVLTERDYFEYVINLNKSDEKDLLPSVIRRELATSTLLFVGYSLEDINFRAIFQGLLSFMSSIDSKFRKLSIAVQIPPNDFNMKDIRMQKYLEQYTRNMFDVHVFWGNTSEFILELDNRWEQFRRMNVCNPVSR